MTRDEAAEVLKHLVDRFYDKYMWSDENVEALTAIAALRGPQPDPDTGLVPCGWCGPERIGWFSWNRAMGWREGNEN